MTDGAAVIVIAFVPCTGPRWLQHFAPYMWRERRRFAYRKKNVEKGGCVPGSQKTVQGEIRHPPLPRSLPLLGARPGTDGHSSASLRLSLEAAATSAVAASLSGCKLSRLRTTECFYLFGFFFFCPCWLDSCLCGCRGHPVPVLPQSSPCLQPITGPRV